MLRLLKSSRVFFYQRLKIKRLLSLGYFKYYGFFVENINALFHTDVMLKSVFLPLGISFYTFHQISYLADVSNGEIADGNFVDYALLCIGTVFLLGIIVELIYLKASKIALAGYKGISKIIRRE